jgi:stage V sporulation protein T
MKATGIVRRMDDMGRVVIPKEIRRQLKFVDGDPLEIYTEGEDTVCFRRYIIDEQKEFKEDCAKFVAKYSRNVPYVMMANNETTLVLTDGRIGKVKKYKNDTFDMNIAIVFAMKNAGFYASDYPNGVLG